METIRKKYALRGRVLLALALIAACIILNSAAEGGNTVTICHIPPGNPGNAHSITVSVSALPAHLAHGDAMGECRTDSTTLGAH
jgi:hypothetical protein